MELADGFDYVVAKKVVQQLDYISDGTVRMKYSESGVNLSGAKITLSGTARYLFVTNNKQERSAPFLLKGTAQIGSPIKGFQNELGLFAD